MIPTTSTGSLSVHESFNPFNKGVRDLRRLVRQHMILIRKKWFRADQMDWNQQRELETRFETLKEEMGILENNSPAYWGVSRVVQEMKKCLNYTRRGLGIRPVSD